MKISEVPIEYLFGRLGKFRVVAIDYNTGEFHELESKTVGFIKKLMEKKGVKFYQIEQEA